MLIVSGDPPDCGSWLTVVKANNLSFMFRTSTVTAFGAFVLNISVCVRPYVQNPSNKMLFVLPIISIHYVVKNAGYIIS